MHETTIGKLLLQSALPPDLHGELDKPLDKAGISELLKKVATRYPDQYRGILKRLADVGRHASFVEGGYSFGLPHLRPTRAANLRRLQMRAELRQILGNPELNDDQRSQAIVDLAAKHQESLPELVYKESLAEQNPLAMQVASGSKGNKLNVNSLRGADLLYTDAMGRPVPFLVDRSYAQGLTPAQFFAASFGARRGVVDLKTKVADAGYASKQLVQAAHRLVVTAHDAEHEPIALRGLPVPVSDPHSVGALLAAPIAGYPRNTVITPGILKTLKDRGLLEILVRSTLVGGPADGGVYARDAGIRERGGIAPVGDFVGIAAANAIGEPIAQGLISSKHSAGVAAAGDKATGFKAIDALIQSPKEMTGRASHAQHDGKVENIAVAPQGGHYVRIAGKEHYVDPNLDLLVKPGDTVEAGDALSDGSPNPAEIVKHKGIGEGRRYFVEAFGNLLKANGIPAHRRNLELIGRGLINHVRLTDEMGDWVPDDILPYQSIEANWQPRSGSITVTPAASVGKYLERPVLHHSIGTRVKKSMLPQLEHYGVKQLTVHHEPPPFEPVWVPGRESVSKDTDWLVRALGSYQQKSLLSGVHRGAVSNMESTSFVPSLAEGINFGKIGPLRGHQK